MDGRQKKVGLVSSRTEPERSQSALTLPFGGTERMESLGGEGSTPIGDNGVAGRMSALSRASAEPDSQRTAP